MRETLKSRRTAKPTRGRPPLYGKAGAYKVAYAKVDRALRGRISAVARRKGWSVSRLLFFMIQSRRTPAIAPASEPASSGTFRMYVQLPLRLDVELRTEASRIKMKLPKYLGWIAREHYALALDRANGTAPSASTAARTVPAAGA